MFKSAVSRFKSAVSGAVRIATSAGVQGTLSISLVYPDRVVHVLKKDNLVVLGGKMRLLQALYLGDAASPISTLRVGNGGTIDPEGQFPKRVNQSLTRLFNEVQSIPVTYSLDVTHPSITYIADIDPELCNSVLLSEAGLFFGNGEMFNIKTFPGIPKTLDFSIHFEWVVKIN